MLVLGIETSCDETSAAVVEDGCRVRSNVVLSQVKDHAPYGGVVPEIASRRHVEALPLIVRQALAEAEADENDLDAVAVTRGPGLASSLLVGVTTAQALAFRLNKPVIGVNHLQAHIYSIFLGADALDERVRQVCPLVVLLVSGGHTQLIRMDDLQSFQLLGQTLDDAAGEALDKGATVLGLGYPGGPAIEKAAVGGDPRRIDFPRGMRGQSEERVEGLRRDYCFSFSGLKTALLYYARNHPEACRGAGLGDTAASYQEAVFDALLDRLERAVISEGVSTFACVGGVARNRRLRSMLEELSRRRGCRLLVAPFEYCTDNAAMIAGWASACAGRGVPPVPVQDIDPTLSLS